jgi:hypothetical protein
MESADRSQPRVLARLVATSSTVFALAIGAHLAGGGAVPGGLGLAVLASLTLAWCAVLAQWRLRVSTLLPAAVGWQWCLHQALSLTSAPAAAVASLPGHASHTGSVGSLLVAASATHHHGASPPMLATHAVATVATVVLLVATEHGAERASQRLRWALPVLLGIVGPPVRPARMRTAVPPAPRRPRIAWVLGTVGSRGPPLRTLSA